MLNKQMRSPDLALGKLLLLHRCTASPTGMVGGHVVLQLIGIGACGGFPARGAVVGVKVIGEVL